MTAGLLLILIIPILGLLGISCIKEGSAKNIRAVSIWTSLFVLSLSFSSLFLAENSSFSILSFYFGADKISYSMMSLTSFVMLMGAAISGNEKVQQPKTLHLLLLGLETILLILFITQDIVIFYILLEMSVILIFVLLRIFSVKSSFRFFVLQSISAAVLLYCISYIIATTGITEINVLARYTFSMEQEKIIFWTCLASFCIQAALFPFHMSPMKISSEAPVSISIILQGIFFKIGLYGIIFILLPMVPHACALYQMPVLIFVMIAISCCIARLIFQHYLRYVISYADAIASLLILSGAFVLNTLGISGAFLSIFAYSITVAALLFFTYLLEKYYGNCTTKLSAVMYRSPMLGAFGEMTILSLCAIPLLPCAVGVYSILYSFFDAHLIIACMLTALIIISCFFEFLLFQKIMFGEKTNIVHPEDESKVIMILFALVMLALGVGSYSVFGYIQDAIMQTQLGEVYKNVSI